MMESDWIDARYRKPTKEDADHKGCVIAWHRYDGTMVTGWHQFGRSEFYTHWMPAPKPPKGFPLWENPPGRAMPDPMLAEKKTETKKP
jgi:hypothetical protein